MSVRDDVRRLLATGLSVNEVAARLGLAPNTVAYHRNRRERRATPVSDLRHTVGRVSTRDEVARLLAQGVAKAEIARRLGVTKATVSYHVGRLGGPVDERAARRYDWAAVQAYYDCGFTKRECEAAFGFSSASWHEAVRRGDIVARSRRIPDDELFVKGVRRNRLHLKLRLLKTGRCAVCGLSSWQGAPLSLALHHRNGDRLDHRIENLELLCPNCHSQTDNFAGRNRNLRLVKPAAGEDEDEDAA